MTPLYTLMNCLVTISVPMYSEVTSPSSSHADSQKWMEKHLKAAQCVRGDGLFIIISYESISLYY